MGISNPTIVLMTIRAIGKQWEFGTQHIWIYVRYITNKNIFFAHQIFSEIWPGPSKGCQIAPKGCQITTPSGLIGTPWQAAGRKNLHSLGQLFPFKGSIVSAEFDGPAMMEKPFLPTPHVVPWTPIQRFGVPAGRTQVLLACLQKCEISKKNE